MNWIDHISSLVNPFELASFYMNHVFGENIQLIMIDAVLILAIHGFYILMLTRLFKRYVSNAAISKYFRMSFLLYVGAIFLVILSHAMDIFVLAVLLDSLKIFPNSLHTFYFISGMYTTIGSSYIPGPEWQSLPILISFVGLFAFSISGSGLYSMLGFFIAENHKTLK
jgi:hypothetical protein